MEINNFGGKANRLLLLQEKKYRIPSFFVIKPNEIYQDLVAQKLEQLSGEYFAVRSSANVEDSHTQSFAGMFATFLFVPKDQVFEKVKEVNASVTSERVREYLNASEQQVEVEMNVIVQEMIDADVSGVAFGKHFTEGEDVLINSAYGLGKAIVDGEVNADHFTGINDKWTQNIAHKTHELKYVNEDLLLQKLPKSKQTIASLQEAQLNEIYYLLKQLEREFDYPQDIEFCYQNGQLYLLQARDITTLQPDFVIWDNSNIVESYPGITLPFTFSFIQNIYATAYRNFGLLLGVSEKQVVANEDVFQAMLGHIKGRVYYHLIHWYKALSLLPGYKINAPFMEKMMGVEEPLGIEVSANQPASKLQAYVQLLNSVRKLWTTNKKLPQLKAEFVHLVTETIRQYREKNYENSSVDEIWQDYLQFKNLLVNQWQPPLANDLFAMIYYGALDKFCKKNFAEQNLHTKLIVGRHEVVSAKPARWIEKMIQTAEEENYLYAIQNEDPETIWKLCLRGELGETGRLIQQYIDEFGDRSVGELKLEHDTFRQKPAALIQILASYHTVSSSEKYSPKTKSIELEKEVKQQLPIYKKWWFSYLVKKAAETVADRENLRLERTKAFGIVRKIINALGEKLSQQALIDEGKDVFYLEEKELNEFVNAKGKNLKEIIHQRKHEYTRFTEYKNLPSRITQKGKLKDSDLLNLKPVEYGDLEGIPCCEGIVRAKIRIMKKPDEVKSLQGEILVTESTDPGWITIFNSAGGILVERGSALSHASIVSRELGIPCIVAIKGITKRLKTGDLIEMDGKTGKIKIIEQAKH